MVAPKRSGAVEAEWGEDAVLPGHESEMLWISAPRRAKCGERAFSTRAVRMLAAKVTALGEPQSTAKGYGSLCDENWHLLQS